MLRPSVALALAALLAACSTPAPPPAAPTPEPTPEAPCCDVDDLVRLVGEGADDAAIIEQITNGRGAVRPLLAEAGVSDAVVEAWLNPPPEPEPEPQPEAKAAAPKPLPLAIQYKAGKGGYKLVNVGTKDLSGLTVLLNGEYRYTLSVDLKADDSDNINLSSHKSIKNGERMAKPVPPPGYKMPQITSIKVTRKSGGSWSKRL